eukprot:1504793-Amphidinium_carterae.1
MGKSHFHKEECRLETRDKDKTHNISRQTTANNITNDKEHERRKKHGRNRTKGNFPRNEIPIMIKKCFKTQEKVSNMERPKLSNDRLNWKFLYFPCCASESDRQQEWRYSSRRTGKVKKSISWSHRLGSREGALELPTKGKQQAAPHTK